jgi:hypothetical protein
VSAEWKFDIHSTTKCHGNNRFSSFLLSYFAKYFFVHEEEEIASLPRYQLPPHCHTHTRLKARAKARQLGYIHSYRNPPPSSSQTENNNNDNRKNGKSEQTMGRWDIF